MPTNDRLRSRGCVVVSMCALCGKAYETADNLFLTCSFASNLWQWLQSFLPCSLDFTSCIAVLLSVNRPCSSQVKDVLISIVVHVFWAIWWCRTTLGSKMFILL